MASARRLTALGILCRRPSSLLTPLTPVVLLVFAGLLLLGSVRSAVRCRVATRFPHWPNGHGVAAVSSVDRSDPVERAGVETLRGETVRVGFRPIGVVGLAAALFGGVLLAASAAGGTYAFLNAQRITPGATISSGTLSVTIQASGSAAGASAAIPTDAWTNMLPGDFAGQTVTVANTGSVGTVLSAQLAGTSAWDIRLAMGACPSTLLTSAPLAAAPSSVATLAAGSTSAVCVQASLPANAAANTENSSSSLSITLTAKQVAP